MPAANDVRKGQVIKFNGEPHLVMETQHRTPGNLRAFVQIKMRNLRYGKTLEQRFNSPDPVEVLPTDRRTLEFSYADRENFTFMDPETFESFELSAAMIGDAKNYLVANGKAEVSSGGRGDLQAPIGGLAPLYSGLLRAADLARVGLLDGSPQALAAADRLFAGPEPWMTDRF